MERSWWKPIPCHVFEQTSLPTTFQGPRFNPSKRQKWGDRTQRNSGDKKTTEMICGSQEMIPTIISLGVAKAWGQTNIWVFSRSIFDLHHKYGAMKRLFGVARYSKSGAVRCSWCWLHLDILSYLQPGSYIEFLFRPEERPLPYSCC